MLQYIVSVLLKHCSSMGACGTHAHRSDAKLQPDVTLHRGRKQLETYLADLLTTGLVSQCKETKTARKKARSVCANADLIASQGSLQEQQVFLLQAVAFLVQTNLAWGKHPMTQVAVQLQDGTTGREAET